MPTLQWGTLQSPVTLLSTELDALGSGLGFSGNLSSAYDNTSGRYQYALFELLVTFGVAPEPTGPLVLLLAPALDGTNAAFVTNLPNALVAGQYYARAVTTQQRLVLLHVPLPATVFHVGLHNGSNQTMAASGNTLRMAPYTEEVA